MAEYVIRAVDMDQVLQTAPEIHPLIEPFKAYDLKEPQLLTESGVLVLPNGKKFIVNFQSGSGFVVRKIYRQNPDEPDPVLRNWGDYESFNMWHASDRRLQDWLRDKVSDSLLDRDFELYQGTKSEGLALTPITYRLRAFDIRRSEKFFGKIALYKDHEGRDNDNLIAMKPARAIALMFPELEHKLIITITDMFLQEFAPRDFTIKRSDKAEDFKIAYSHDQSPNENIETTTRRKSLSSSCMRYDFDHLPCHPAEAYASGDFEVIYTLDNNACVGSRCVVYNSGEGSFAGPIYGVSEQSINTIRDYLQLHSIDFADCGDWVGARLKRIPNGDDAGFIAPYLDLQPQRLTDTGNHLIIENGGDIDASQYSGVLDGHYTTCYSCGDGVSEDEYYYSEHTNENYCECCYHSEHFYCEYLDECVHHDDTGTAWETGYGGGYRELTVSKAALEDGDSFVKCNNGEWWHVDDAVYCEYEDEFISPRTIDEYFWSSWDGELYPISGMCNLADGESVFIDELENDSGIWQKNSDDIYENVQKELDL